MWKLVIEPYYISNQGELKNIKTGKILKLQISNKGYYKTNIRIKGKTRTVFIHQLVAQAFIPNPYNLPLINHKDGNKLNNFEENLEWITASGNVKHAIEKGLIITKQGEECKQSKLTENDILQIRALYKQGYSFKELSLLFNVCRGNISQIIAGKTWKHLL